MTGLYSRPLVQVILVGIVLLLTSGMFNALNGMGGGGQLDTKMASNANVALYTTFSVGGLVAGGIVNIIGPKYAMAIGGTTFALYAGSLLNYNHNKNDAFVIAAGALLGLGAALIWTGEGAIVTSYPSEKNKGKYIGIFWGIFNLGAVLGSIIPLVLNWNSKEGSVNDGTYIGFLVLMSLGSLSALALLPPSKVFHKDGRAVAVERFPSWTSESIKIMKLFLDWRMICLIPMFLASNWFYAYQFNDVNGFYFNIRTRAFNDIWYWIAQIFGALVFGKFLDTPLFGRRQRAIFGLLILFFTFMATWIGGLIFQLTYRRSDTITPMDLFDRGFYKAIQSAGGAISWRIDAVGTAFLPQLLICWILLIVSIPGAMIVALNVKETNYLTDNSADIEKSGIGDGKVGSGDNNELATTF
ncbi:12889_t:CDS:2 [Ambispora leptoticha]|uniref:12889_t:CDS:1 n=1 Tax=Ambispora leptoticha TaxID=144679 RepID=A0A9N8WBQ1_9GLOM|nr:12889_t:CDS:2 [Ambispora leptoticha]